MNVYYKFKPHVMPAVSDNSSAKYSHVGAIWTQHNAFFKTVPRKNAWVNYSGDTSGASNPGEETLWNQFNICL